MGSLHSTVCLIEFFTFLGLALTGIFKPDFWPPLFYVAFAALFAFPLANEAVLTIKGYLCRLTDVPPKYLKDGAQTYECLPIVYSPKYNITAFGFEKLHPFDSQKY